MKAIYFMLSLVVATALAACGESKSTTPTPVETVFSATLSSDQEVPAVTVATTATGSAEVKLVGNQITISGTFKDLTGVPTKKHIHGPGAAGTSGPVISDITASDATSGTISGTLTLTDEQITALKAGLLYFNLHTTANPTGEIRGQITAK